MPCIASRIMIAAFAAYVLASLSHSPLLTWAAVAVSVVTVVAWSRRARLVGATVPACGSPCSIEPEWPDRARDLPNESPPVELVTVSVSEERP